MVTIKITDHWYARGVLEAKWCAHAFVSVNGKLLFGEIIPCITK